ncbi:hypothetical protein HPHPM3_1700 [Helicobacter pylori Hp M3]|nr:hypothetical protein HPHPM3_1700 [Helicobacter pylori Hp M3]
MHVYNYISFLKTSFKKFFNLKPLKQVIEAKKLLKIKSSLAGKTWRLKRLGIKHF